MTIRAGRDERDVPLEDRETARLLERSLVRFHPSFRFEERLAARLAAVVGPSDPAVVIPFPASSRGPARPARDRRVLVGGAVASGVSLAGAALVVARRRGRLA